ncbi:rna-directed dna polymerase from mobile element jockey-like [Limosa lapponica baueri]|uniref:Rna-directed dna polymerase from mobile element jockey-like n=1 Tax=Limosa lapponica baueri TaxID=1758121 RepID=A0A2I0T8Y8_LIMLA|nr:rna-directed dna polymerase from mobile element jockey-like [Limosa lapponica baueri]
MRKAKAHLELNLVRDIKDSRKDFFKYISSKRKTRENVGPLLNEVAALVMEDAEKAELLNAFFASVFTTEANPQEPQTQEVGETAWNKEVSPLIEEDCVRDHLTKLDTHKPMGPDGMHQRVLRELANVIVKLPSIVFERSWGTGEVPEDWSRANVPPVSKKGKKEDAGNYRPQSASPLSLESKIDDESELGEVADTPEDFAAIQNDLDARELGSKEPDEIQQEQE